MIARAGRWVASPLLSLVNARRDRTVLAAVGDRHVTAVVMANGLGWPVRRAGESLERLAAAGCLEWSWASGGRRYRMPAGGR